MGEVLSLAHFIAFAYFINENMEAPFITFAQGHLAVDLRFYQILSGFCVYVPYHGVKFLSTK